MAFKESIAYFAEEPLTRQIILSLLSKYKRPNDNFEMPDKTVALPVRFLEQGQGRLSERAKNKEFEALTPDEIVCIEERYREVFQ